MSNKVSKVRNYFEDKSNYLGTDGKTIGIMSRQEIVKSMLEGKVIRNLLDVPCGNGLLSIPLHNQSEKLTLIDIAERMILESAKNIPECAAKGKFKLVHGNVFDLDLKEKYYDCILAIGILAHIDNPTGFIELLDKVLIPGGDIIIQNTDHSHIKIKVQKILNRNRQLTQEGKYELNSISHKWLLNFMNERGFRLVNTYRYETNIPFFSCHGLEDNLSIIWKLFGKPPKNRFSFLGSKCIYHFRKKD